ncbi:4'-phosphopantetheinyl transferase family protein [Poseidonocella sedimentorum]|uniref:Enterobactin synthase component D n=1 Tax=Poseidonocella sedimentorum TaxID=871652 RepID=A0A1I6DL49_9RHOB|nr:4'-phosphopantetheinyl transferase superfamily protein [Poseidonocella sedimentorum]SFR06078.1 4'-phosphopantetheinyl transferase EntD (siderophore biosynthesis) [Poseidonocella sedimentorum]
MTCGPVLDATQSLFPGEGAQIVRAVEKRRREFSTGRLYARSALAKLGYPPVALVSHESRRPCWPEGAIGSITHADDFCAVMVASRSKVMALGLDIERIKDVSDSLLPQLSEPDEQEDLLRHLDPDLLPALTFSAREAIFKAYNPVTEYPLSFKDVRLSVEGGSFAATMVRPDIPSLFGHKRIHGQFACVEGLVISVVAFKS